MAEVQSVSQKGRELVDLSETAQLDNLEDRINHVNELWEDLSSLAEKRQTTLQHQKKQVFCLLFKHTTYSRFYQI
jgi:TolA-binding protein